jgi:hypothetical protein
MAADLGKLASALASQGVNPDSAMIITSGANAMKIKVLSGPGMTQHEVVTSGGLPDGTVIMIAPEGFWTAYHDTNIRVEINQTTSAMAQFDTTPVTDPLTAGTTRSLYQAGLIGIKVVSDVAWAVNPGAVAYLTGVAW